MEEEVPKYIVTDENSLEDIIKDLLFEENCRKVVLTNVPFKFAIEIIADLEIYGVITRHLDHNKDMVEIFMPDIYEEKSSIIIYDYFLVDLGIEEEPYVNEVNNLSLISNIVD